jgi:hypothetical protein
MANQKLNIDIVAKDKSTQAFNKVQGSLAKVKDSLFNLKNAFIGLGAGLVLRGIVNAGMQIEELGVQLEALFGSAKKGQSALDAVTKFAKTTPFELSNIQQGVTALATVSEKAESLGVSFDELLKITGNTAVQLGGDFALASQQIQRSFSAGIGSADLFRDRAVTAMAGFQAGVAYNVDESVKKLAGAFGTGGKFGELTNKLAQTLKGTVSNLKDAYFTIQTEIAKGFFDELKRQLGDLKKFTEDNDQAIRRLSREMGENLAVAILKVSNALKTLTTNFRDYQSIIGLVAIATGGFTGKLIGAGLIIDDVKRRIDKLAGKDNEIKINLDALYDDMPQALEKVKEAVVDLAQAEESIAKAKEKELKLQNFLLEQANMKRLKFHELETEGVKKLQEMNITFEQMNKNSLEQIKEKFTNISTSIKEGLNAGISGFSNALARAIILGEDLGKAFKSMVQDALIKTVALLIEAIIRFTILKFLGIDLEKGEDRKLQKAKAYNRELKISVALATILAFLTGGASMGGGFLSTSGGSMKKGGSAKGGALRKGQASIVGENGPELFIPNSTGQITQSARGTGGGETNVNFTINATDVRGIKELLINNRSTIVNVINSALNEKGKEALV